MSTPDDRRFPDDDLPEGSVLDGLERGPAIDEAFDFVVVGSGAAGSVAAHALATAGHSVAIVEEGPWIKTRQFGTNVGDAFRTMFRDLGLQVLKGRAYLPMIQGVCVGGSTLVNSAIAWRIPEDVVDDWSARFGLGDSITMRLLEPHFEALEHDLNVTEVADEVLGENNGLFIREAERAGHAPTRMRRYERGCKGSGRCLQGCPNAAKQSMSITYVPWALRLGARIFTSCRVDRVEIRGGRAVGVSATGKSGRKVSLRARRGVVVAASTVQTPNILRRSGLRSRHIGEHFQVHPGLGVGGLFDKPIDISFGATQGAESIAYRKSDRFKLETISLPPEMAAARLPGVGAELSSRLARLGHVAMWAVQVRSEAEGTVRSTWGGRDAVRFTPTENDMRTTRKATVLLVKLMLDAGAREVWPGIYGGPASVRTYDDLKQLEEVSLDPRAYSFIATHLFGAARMGPDPRASVVGTDFQTHEAERLYVVDSSVFPTNLGVNPQHSIMALARLAAHRIADRARCTVAA
jgi:choline dehydrogenase-like flavoprotein